MSNTVFVSDGVGSLTRDGNDLYMEVEESGAILSCARYIIRIEYWLCSFVRFFSRRMTIVI